MPFPRELLQDFLDLLRHALGTNLDPVVRETSGVALCGVYYELVLTVLLL